MWNKQFTSEIIGRYVAEHDSADNSLRLPGLVVSCSLMSVKSVPCFPCCSTSICMKIAFAMRRIIGIWNVCSLALVVKAWARTRGWLATVGFLFMTK